MKFLLLVYLFTPSGEYLWKDVIPVADMKACESRAAKYTHTVINSRNMVSFFCLTEEQYTNGRQQEYEGQLNPIDEHEANEN